MEGWTIFWGWTLICVLVAFTVVAIVVTIGGFSDIRVLLKSLSDSKPSSKSSEDE